MLNADLERERQLQSFSLKTLKRGPEEIKKSNFINLCKFCDFFETFPLLEGFQFLTESKPDIH